jgi:hypothetical protein
MAKESGRKWDGRSRITTEFYRKRYDEIFNKKTQELDSEEEIYNKNKHFFKGENLQDIGDRMEEEIEKIKND